MDIDVMAMKINRLEKEKADLERRVAALEAEVLPPVQGAEELDVAEVDVTTEIPAT